MPTHFASILSQKNLNFKDKKVSISGSGNVAQYAAEKVTSLGGKVITMSDSSGFILDKDGIDAEKLNFLMKIKNIDRERISKYAEKFPSATFFQNSYPSRV